MNAVTTTLLILFILLAFDAFWLTINYTSHASLFQSIQKTPMEIRILPAILTYLLMAGSIYYFVFSHGKPIKPAAAATKGAALGFVMYGLYDLTNYSTLTNYTLTMTLKDWIWGTFLFTSTGAITAFVQSRLQ